MGSAGVHLAGVIVLRETRNACEECQCDDGGLHVPASRERVAPEGFRGQGVRHKEGVCGYEQNADPSTSLRFAQDDTLMVAVRTGSRSRANDRTHACGMNGAPGTGFSMRDLDVFVGT